MLGSGADKGDQMTPVEGAGGTMGGGGCIVVILSITVDVVKRGLASEFCLLTLNNRRKLLA